MRINWPKTFSLLGSIASLFFAIKWIIGSSYHPEPIIASIGLVTGIIIQLSFWRTKNVFKYVLENEEKADTAIEQILNFAQYDYKITVNPKHKKPYWRFGIKFSEDFNITLDRLTPGNPLFHLTQTYNNILSVHYYDENNQSWTKGESQIDNKYKYDPIQIFVSSDLHNLTVEVLKNNTILLTHQLNRKFMYAKLSAWADGQEYKIESKVKRIPKY